MSLLYGPFKGLLFVYGMITRVLSYNSIQDKLEANKGKCIDKKNPKK